jgi:5-methyltetrahydrofolate--homocysteine methyltransferase
MPAAKQEQAAHAAIEDARENVQDRLGDYTPPSRAFLGREFPTTISPKLVPLHRLDAVLPDLGTVGPLSAILEDPKQGEAARALYNDAQAMLKRRIARKKWLRRRR